jgi:hypothetical protein
MGMQRRMPRSAVLSVCSPGDEIKLSSIYTAIFRTSMFSTCLLSFEISMKVAAPDA